MPSEGLGSFRRSFRPELRAAAAARRDLEDLCAGVDDDLLDRSCLILTEVVTNSVKHARLRPSQRIDVSAWLIDQLTDRWGVDCSHGTRVWLVFDRDP